MSKTPRNSEKEHIESETEAFFKKHSNTFKNLFKSKYDQPSIDYRKEKVWHNIQSTISKKREKPKYLTSLSIAASIAVLLGCSIWVFYYISNPFDPMEAIADKWSIENLEETQLILSNEDKVLMKEEESFIDYVGGGKISINAVINETADLSSLNSLIVPHGKRSRLTLEDGTIVWVNSGSKLIYPVAFGEKERRVFVEGEAFFEVSEDSRRPFLVQTTNMDIKVLGTGFNISAYGKEDKTSAVLVHGSIELTVNKGSLLNKKKQILKPNERALYGASGNSLIIKQIDTEYYVSWKDGYLKFRNSKLHTIIDKIEKYYNVEISFREGNMGNETFTGKLDLKNEIEEVLNIISSATSLKFTKNERGFILEKDYN